MKETDMLSYALCLQYSCVYNSRVFVINNDFKEIILSTWMENHKRLSGRQVICRERDSIKKYSNCKQISIFGQ